MTNHLVVLSGGMDSTVALATALRDMEFGDTIQAVSFSYGQRHKKELAAARAVVDYYTGIPYRVISLDGLMSGSALLYEGDVPHGHYAEENMKSTVVQGRNLLFASAAVAATGSTGNAKVWLGVHAGDHPIYPDCRPEFWDRLRGLVFDAYGVALHTPFLGISKADVAKRGAALNAPLGLTWSCYEGGEIHCGKCGTCVERAEAFHLAGVPDPTPYADADFWREAVKIVV
jgi:7-cyano-7-deazaguanine synthase